MSNNRDEKSRKRRINLKKQKVNSGLITARSCDEEMIPTEPVWQHAVCWFVWPVRTLKPLSLPPLCPCVSSSWTASLPERGPLRSRPWAALWIRWPTRSSSVFYMWVSPTPNLSQVLNSAGLGSSLCLTPSFTNSPWICVRAAVNLTSCVLFQLRWRLWWFFETLAW